MEAADIQKQLCKRLLHRHLALIDIQHVCQYLERIKGNTYWQRDLRHGYARAEQRVERFNKEAGIFEKAQRAQRYNHRQRHVQLCLTVCA